MKVEIPDLGEGDFDAKSASVKFAWLEDKEGNPYLRVTCSAKCNLAAGGMITPEKQASFDIHDSEACDCIRAFKKVADLLRLKADVTADLANEQKPLFDKNGVGQN